MRNTTKMKLLLQENDLTVHSPHEGRIEIIVTNKETGNAHLVTGISWTKALERALRDTTKAAHGDSLKF